jgi:hypothetical protein
VWIDMHEPPGPKRGDLIQTNVGKPRERTWLVLRSRHMKRAKHPRRYMIWLARWWELEPEMRMRLYRSAERNGGQRCIWMDRYPAKKKQRADVFAPCAPASQTARKREPFPPPRRLKRQ